MSDSISLNDAVRKYPHASERYRRVFNAKAEELDLDVRWKSDRHDPNSLEPDEVEIAGKGCSSFDPQTTQKIRTVLNKVEAERKELVAKSVGYHEHIDFRAPLDRLKPVERAAVEFLNDEVKPILNHIEALQCQPQADAQVQWMSHYGDPNTKGLFTRFHRDQMAGPWVYDERASLMPTFPDLPPINGMISPDISLDEFKALAAQLPPTAQEMRPTTMLTKENGKILAHAIAQDPRFRADHLALADKLEKLSKLKVEGESLHPALRAQFSNWAQYCRSGSLEDESRAVQSSIDAGEAECMLRVHLGPSESYWEDNVKFPYILQVGVSDVELKKEVADWKGTHKALEESLADIPNYQPRPVKTRGGFADPVYGAVIGGFLESFSAREIKGFNFPNYPYPGVEGSNRYQMQESMAPVPGRARELAGRLLDRVPDKLDDFLDLSTLFHESGHLLGPQRNHITPSGVPLGLAFGTHWGWAEEPKADLTVAEMISRRAQDGQLPQADKQAFMECVATEIMSYYSGKQGYKDGNAHDHYYGFLLQIGYYLQTGAVEKVETPQGPRLHLDSDKIEKSSHDLWRKLITFEAAGAKDDFLAFGNAIIEAIPDDVDKMIMDAQGDARPYFIDRHF